MEASIDQNPAQKSAAPAGFFRVPGLFVRLSSKGLNAVDPDSAWSPTSPLDFKNLSSNAGGASLRLRTSPPPPRVGLGLVDALTADEGSSSSCLAVKSSFLESIRPFLELGLPKAAVSDAASAILKRDSVGGVTLMSEIAEFAQSEEYTCVIEHGPNPRTTHILGGGTVEICNGVSKKSIFTIEPIGVDEQPSTAPAGAASGSCFFCRKKLQEDRDVYMYLGEHAFCSNECRKGCIEEEIEEVEELMMLDSASTSAIYLDEDW